MSTRAHPVALPRRPRPQPAGRQVTLVAVAAVALVVAVALAIGNAGTDGSDGTDTAATPAAATGGHTAHEIPTPGTSSGHAAAGGIEVDGAVVAMGRVPLDVTVTPTWRLRNTSSEPVTIGEPHAEVVAGCCPGQLTLDRSVLPPGAETDLRFPLQMHPGMDGPHDFRVHVPVGDEILTLGVTGDFRA